MMTLLLLGHPVKFWLTLLLKKESRAAAMATVSSNRMTLDQHAVERLQKSNVPVTDDSYKYLYRRTPDGYGKILMHCIIIMSLVRSCRQSDVSQACNHFQAV